MPWVPEVTITVPNEPKTPDTELEPPAIIEPIDNIKALEQALFALINQERINTGKRTLLWSDYWHRSARKHSEVMAATGEFEHSVLNCYENIFRGEHYELAEIPKVALETWMDSPGHRANLLTNGVYKCGIGLAKGNGFIYATYMAD